MALKVLLATDGSSNASEAVYLVSQMGKNQPLEVILMTVIQLPEVGGMVAVESWLPELLEREQAAAKEIHDEAMKFFDGTQAVVTSVIREGLVGYELVVEAEKQNADLVVIGAKGHTALDRILLGSVSDYVATHAPCSVVVARPTGLREDSQRRIRAAVGFDDSLSAEHAIEEFNRYQLPNDLELDVIAVCHVVRTFRQDLLPNIAEARAKMREGYAQAAASGARALQRLTPHVHSHVIEAEHIGQALVDFADAHRTDFVVVGDTERGMLGRLFIGSVSRYVLRHAACSVWISRQHKPSEA